MERIPTGVALSHTGISSRSTTCVTCTSGL